MFRYMKLLLANSLRFLLRRFRIIKIISVRSIYLSWWCSKDSCSFVLKKPFRYCNLRTRNKSFRCRNLWSSWRLQQVCHLQSLLVLLLLFILDSLWFFAIVVLNTKMAINLTFFKECSKLENHAADCLTYDLVYLQLVVLYVSYLVTDELYIRCQK